MSIHNYCYLRYKSVGPREPRPPPSAGGLVMDLHDSPAAAVLCVPSSSHSGYFVLESVLVLFKIVMSLSDTVT